MSTNGFFKAGFKFDMGYLFAKSVSIMIDEMVGMISQEIIDFLANKGNPYAIKVRDEMNVKKSEHHSTCDKVIGFKIN